MLRRVFPQLQLLALSIAAARYLGPEGTGRLSVIAFVALTLVLVATAGFPASLGRFVGELLGARSGGVGVSLYRWTWRVELAAAVLTTVGLVAVAVLGADPQAGWALAGVSCGLAVLQAVPNSLLLAAQRWRESTIVGVVTGIAAVAAGIAVLAAGGGITGFFAAEAGAILINLVWTASLARRLAVHMPPPAPIPADVRGRFISFAAYSTGIVAIQFVVWQRSELFFLDGFSSDTQIALYSIAFAVVYGLARIPEAVATVAVPVAATLVGAGQSQRLRAGYWRALRLLLFAVPPVVAGALATGPAALRLVYGDAFAGAGDVLLIMLAPLLVIPLLTLSQSMLYVLGQLRFLVAVGLAAAVVNVALALALIPAHDAIGAAISNSVSQVAAGLAFLYLAWRLLGPPRLAWGSALRGLVLAGLVAAAAAAAQAALGDGVAGVMLAMLAGVAVFVVGGPLLRPLPPGDAAWLASAFGLEARPRLARVFTRYSKRLS